jgi:hypothetical protein
MTIRAHGRLDCLTAARAEALFASDLSAATGTNRDAVSAAIADALRRFGGTRGCACEVAAAYGDHPETAAPRMRWALDVVQGIYNRPEHRAGPAPRSTGEGIPPQANHRREAVISGAATAPR